MSINLKVAKRYSKGLYDFAQQTGEEKVVYNELNSLYELIKNSKELRAFLNSPVIDPVKKTKIAKEVFAKYSKAVQTFIALTIKHKREDNLPEICKAYQNLYHQNNNITDVHLTTSIELENEVLEKIYKESKLIPQGAKINLIKKIDPKLIGGYILRVGDSQIDNSIQSKLEDMKKSFEVNMYVPKF